MNCLIFSIIFVVVLFLMLLFCLEEITCDGRHIIVILLFISLSFIYVSMCKNDPLQLNYVSRIRVENIDGNFPITYVPKIFKDCSDTLTKPFDLEQISEAKIYGKMKIDKVEEIANDKVLITYYLEYQDKGTSQYPTIILETDNTDIVKALQKGKTIHFEGKLKSFNDTHITIKGEIL